ncbi:MAG: hypothetical protein ACRDU5_03915 [Mycobacterium sp.]
MKTLGFVTIVAGGLAAAVLGPAAPADAAPSGPGNAQETIDELQAAGYHVVVNRIGSAPLNEASVVAVRPAQSPTFADPTVPGPGDDLSPSIAGTIFYVDVR